MSMNGVITPAYPGNAALRSLQPLPALAGNATGAALSFPVSPMDMPSTLGGRLMPAPLSSPPSPLPWPPSPGPDADRFKPAEAAYSASPYRNPVGAPSLNSSSFPAPGPAFPVFSPRQSFSPIPPAPPSLSANGTNGFSPWRPNGAQPFNSLSNPGVSPLAPSPSVPSGASLTPPQETGKQVGDLVTRFLEETPALQEKIQHIDWNALSQEDLKPKLEKYRAVVQQALKHSHVPQLVDRKLIRLLDDPKNQQLATEFDAWLRKEPTAEVLTSISKPKPHGHPNVDNFEKPTPGEDFDDGEPLPDEAPQSMLGKLTARAQEGYNSLKNFVFNRTSALKPEQRPKPDPTTLDEDELGDADWTRG